VVIAKTCKRCGAGYELEREPGQAGRPRDYCFDCVPAGYKAVLLPRRFKVRRLHPIGPRIPKGGLAKVYRLTP